MLKSEFLRPSPAYPLLTLCPRRQIGGLLDMFESVCDEVKHTTNFNSFVPTGGPTPTGEGGYQMFQ